MHRRTKDDAEWQNLKNKCKIRDSGQCRCCGILLASEQNERQSQSDFSLQMTVPTDVAHIEPVSLHLDKTYDLNNVVFLCRWCHSHIDNFYSPVNGRQLDKNEHWYWWVRVRYKKTFSYDKDIDYEALYHDMENEKETTKKSVMDWW